MKVTWVYISWCDEDCHEVCKGLMMLASLTGQPYYCGCECHRRVEATSE